MPRYEVRFTNKNHPFMWLVCKTGAIILLSDPETSLTTPRLLPLRRSRRSYGNYQSPQSSGSSRNILKRLGRSGRSGRSYGNRLKQISLPRHSMPCPLPLYLNVDKGRHDAQKVNKRFLKQANSNKRFS